MPGELADILCEALGILLALGGLAFSLRLLAVGPRMRTTRRRRRLLKGRMIRRLAPRSGEKRRASAKLRGP
jgi:hypothetical protein